MLIAIFIVVGVLAVVGMRTLRTRADRLERRLAALRDHNRRLAARDAVRAAFGDAASPLEQCLASAVDDLMRIEGVDGAAIVTRRTVIARGAAPDAIDELAELSPQRRLSASAAQRLFAERDNSVALPVVAGGATFGALVLAGPAALYSAPFVEDARGALAAALCKHLKRCRAGGKSANRRTTTVMATEELWQHRRSAARRSRNNAATRDDAAAG